MAPGLFLVIFWLIVVSVTLFLIGRWGWRQFQRWLNEPEEPLPPPPEMTGAECIVLQFPEAFMEAVPKAEVPEWRRNRYTEVHGGKLIFTQKLAEAMILAALVELWHKGLLQFRVAPKDPDPFDPLSLNFEVFVRRPQPLPLTPLGRCLEVGFRQATRPLWFFRPARSEAVLEDLIEFALREVRRCLGWRKARRDGAENLILYVREFLAMKPPSPEKVTAVKKTLASLRDHDERLEEALKATVTYTLTALRRLEPDRDEFFL